MHKVMKTGSRFAFSSVGRIMYLHLYYKEHSAFLPYPQLGFDYSVLEY